MHRSSVIVLLALPILATWNVGTAGPTTTYTIDPAVSHVVVHVDKSGLFSFMGHTHEVAAPVASGTIVLQSGDPAQSEVRVEFDAAALTVTGKGEPAADVPEVQRTMESEQVLDVARFGRVTFVSRSIRVIARPSNRVRLSVTGDLTLHGVTNSTTTEVVAEVMPDRLTASGTLTIKQTAFGIEPVTAGAGTVRVKDAVDVQFTFVGRSTTPPPAPRAAAERRVRSATFESGSRTSGATGPRDSRITDGVPAATGAGRYSRLGKTRSRDRTAS